MKNITIGRRSFFLGAVAAAVSSALPATAAHASGGSSGPHVSFATQGHIGEVIVNPYSIAPLTAIIRNGGYELTEATVRIVPKPQGQEIKYKVSRSELLTHAGIPVFGLYPDYMNTVETTYTRKFHGKTEKFTDTYKIYAAPVYHEVSGSPGLHHNMFETKVTKVDAKFSDRLYLVNNLMQQYAKATRAVWNNPMGGAMEWNFYPQNAIIDTKGEVRWWLLDQEIGDNENPWKSGYFMGFQQTKDGALTWGYGQNYCKYDLIGRKVYDRRLPSGYSDFSHSFDNAQNGHSFLRVGSADYRRADGRRVHTVRDVIVEIDQDGRVVDDFRLMEILDPYRDNVIKTLDQGAVCLNIDASKAGQTISAAELAEMDKSDNFGDVVGVGAGRNWAHVNSVDYDPTDDSIIISSRHQSAAIKIGRDKKVKWILGAPDGWKKGWAEKVLQPVDKDGKPIKCENGKCEGNFDWTWTQHTAYRIDEMSDADTLILSVFDNGDGRGLEQPALAEEKYTRGVIYKIDQKKMTVQQLWEVGKDLGHEYFSPVTGITKYMADKNSVVVFYSTAGLLGPSAGPNVKEEPAHPYLTEYRWGETKPAVELKINSVMGYQAFPISVEQAFTH
ncbi:MAG: aryl-sulfate sulfotransferase [Sutterella wadsworthensis]|nr:aryl-sulfate sulfotransferase [Sutterella wadsworthensis]